jgi:mRNA interferase RelE/StbE
MPLFPAEFSSKSRKYIKKLDGTTKKRIKSRVDHLEDDPFPKEVERVKDYIGEKVFRVRVGDQRILYTVRYNPNKLIIVKVDKKSKVYD